MIHDFRESLAKSHAQADAPWWGEVYRKAFPGLQAMIDLRRDGWHQRAGIDRMLVLKSSKAVLIDEKVRSKDYDDILLERWSDEAKRKPGWVQKDLACDFIAYAFVPSQRCYLLPFLLLRKAWLEHGRSWCEIFPEKRAQNHGYVTVSVAVPIEILMGALERAMLVRWGESNPNLFGGAV